MVEVFKTNVYSVQQAAGIIELLAKRFPDYRINFDLDDCDKILRVENKDGSIEPREIIQIVETLKYAIEIFED